MANALFVGLMSGTSTDGVDAVLGDFTRPARPNLMASTSLPMPQALREEFLALNIPGQNELARAALAGNALARMYAEATHAVLALAGIDAKQVCAIGAHGQTVRHDPAAGYTLQINAPALLAELTGIAVIADFRSRDVAAGGQGAPLVPAFHQALFAGPSARTILNLGGIANVTLLGPGGDVRGFDTGPANVLLDLWMHAQRGHAFDEGGAWAASGRSHPGLLDFLLKSEPWFDLSPPKSTGRDLFNWRWLAQRLDTFGPTSKGLSAADVQATLVQFTAQSVARAVRQYAGDTQQMLVCGGGAFNPVLMQALQDAMPWPVQSTAELGIPVNTVEALAFAWLAWAHEHKHPAGLPTVTGATRANILGCKYPA